MTLRDQAASDAALASVNGKPTWVRLDWLVANAPAIAEAMWGHPGVQLQVAGDIRRLVQVLRDE